MKREAVIILSLICTLSFAAGYTLAKAIMVPPEPAQPEINVQEIIDQAIKQYKFNVEQENS